MSKINNKNSTIKRVLLQIRPYLPTIILLLALAVVSVLCSLYIPVLVGDAIDAIIGKEQVNFAVILPKLFTCAVLIGCAALAQWLMNVCGNKVTYNTIRDMREAAFKKIHRLPFSYLDAHETGDIVSRIIADVDQFADGLLMGFSQLFTGVVTIIGTIGFMLSVNVWTTLVVVLVTPLSILVARFIAKKTFAMFRLQSETRGRQTAFINEMITNQKVVRAYGHEDENMEKFDTINEELRRHTLKATFFSSITNPATRFVNSVVYAAVALIGAFLAVTGQGFTIGMLSCFLSYANQYTKPFNEISGVITELQNALACADRLLEFLDSEEMSADPELLPEHSETAKGQVTFDNVCFSYTKDRPLIRNFSLDVPAGCRVAIVGPTGCGKTWLGVELAKMLGGEVVSCDSMQIYRGMAIGTAAPTAEEMQGIPHHMVGVADPRENYSVARYADDAAKCVDDILSRGKQPVIVGGTGLYLNALLAGHGFAGGDKDGRYRAELESRWDKEGGEAMFAELRRIDPETAGNLHLNDKKRILRALEVYYETGKTMAQHNAETKLTPPRYDSVRIGLAYEDRDDMKRAIDLRVDKMVEAGLFDEVRALLDSGLPRDVTAMQAIGYKETLAYLDGEAAREEAIDEIKLRSRQYAKRQLTWLRRDPSIHWFYWKKTRILPDCLAFSTEILHTYGVS